MILDRVLAAVIALGIFVIVAAPPVAYVWFEHALWAECRAGHSFFYCLRTLGWM